MAFPTAVFEDGGTQVCRVSIDGTLTFTGTVTGAATTGALTYAGVTLVGGAIGAELLLFGPARAAPRADAIAGVGGTYAGVTTAQAALRSPA